jgi:membrane-associated phospholipid phosphatase
MAWMIAHRNGTLTEIMVSASRFGSTPSLVVIALLATAWLIYHDRRADAVFLALGTAGGLALAPLLKLVFTRSRPPIAEHIVVVDSWSFPSAHSANSMAVLGLLTVLAIRARPGRLRRTLLAVLGAFLVFVVGFSRVYLGVHWPSDVLAGWVVGALWVAGCFGFARFRSRNRRSSGTVQRGS